MNHSTTSKDKSHRPAPNTESSERAERTERFELRDRPGPAGIVLSSHKTLEEAEKALATRRAEAKPGEEPLIADMGERRAPGAQPNDEAARSVEDITPRV